MQSDGKIIVASNYEEEAGQRRGRVLRLEPNGAIDPSFAVQNTSNTILALALQKDGKPVLGGSFTLISSQVNGAAVRVWLARLSATSMAVQRLAVDSDAWKFAWRPGTLFPAFHRVEFAVSTDGASYTPIASGVWLDNRWQANVAAAPLNRSIWLRVRGALAGGGFNASTGQIESVARAYIPGGELEIATLVTPTHSTPPWKIEVAGPVPFTSAWRSNDSMYSSARKTGNPSLGACEGYS